MKETSFIKQKKKNWEEFEKVLEQENQDPDDLKDIFIEVTDDLSYSRTFYPNRSVRVYLNGLAQKIFQSIYKNKKSEKSRLKLFWTDELPKLVYESRAAFNLSFLVFLGAFLIGWLSSSMDIEFARIILGDSYVDMTIENIDSGDPMKVYKESKQFGMSMGITINNLWVAFLTFILGVFYAIGTIGILLSNGIMVGAFQHFFYEKGVFMESFLTIWIHGTLEISAIIIAGAAGITMGRGLVFPGTLSRVKSFQISAKRGLKIMIGITPIFILAGFIEGYLTRMTETPDFIRAFFIFLCLAFILFYFVWYPKYKARVGYNLKFEEDKIPPDNRKQIEYFKIKSIGQVFTDAFRFLSKNTKTVLLTALTMSSVHILSVIFLFQIDVQSYFYFENNIFQKLAEVPQFFYIKGNLAFFFMNVLLVSILTYVILNKLMMQEQIVEEGDDNKEKNLLSNIFRFLKIFTISILTVGLIASNDWYTLLAFLLIFPFILFWKHDSFIGRQNIVASLVSSFGFFGTGFGKGLGLMVSYFLLGGFFYCISATSLFWLFLDFIAMNVNMEQADLDTFVTSMMIFTNYFLALLIYSLFLTGFAFLYYSNRETLEAVDLNERIQEIGMKKRIRGIEREI